MTKPTNKNSILVLATIGVYLGLVLVGAAPTVLAQAAMTREFSVKDEIEVKSDLDTKPEDIENTHGDCGTGVSPEVARSVQRFLSQFHKVDLPSALLASVNPFADLRELRTKLPVSTRSLSVKPNFAIRSILSPSNLARAGL